MSPTDSDAELDTGTTVVGIVAGGGADETDRDSDPATDVARDDVTDADANAAAADPAVVLATDRRASLGHMVSSKSARKIEPLADHAAMAFSGSVSGADALSRQLRAEISLYQTRRGHRMSPEAVASLVANTLREAPMGVMPVVAAVDDEAHLFSYDTAGGRSDDDYAAVGSGTPYALGHLETAYEAGLSVEAAREIAVDAVRVASERDTASGNGYNLAVVRSSGVEIESDDSLARTA